MFNLDYSKDVMLLINHVTFWAIHRACYFRAYHDSTLTGVFCYVSARSCDEIIMELIQVYRYCEEPKL